MSDFTNTDNIINSSDIVERYEELKDERESLESAIEEAKEQVETAQGNVSDMQQSYNELVASSEEEGLADAEQSLALAEEELEDAENALTDAQKELAEWIADYQEEFDILDKFADELPSRRDNEVMIHESYFTDYCQELVSDIGDLPREIPSYIEIDWEATAENLKADYTEIDFDGETYYMRSC